ncbi:MAG: serine/threonine-protein kinase, partial [Planctomycetota bacterium]
MNADRYREVQDCFLRLRDLPREERVQELARLEDQQLAEEVRSLLEHDVSEERLFKTHDGLGRANTPTESLGVSDTPQSSVDPTRSEGERIEAYALGEVLGRGGFGTVYRAIQHEPIHREVAIKLINPGMDSEAVLRRFETERQTLASLNHPGIASVFDAGTSRNGEPYFVMELVPGTPMDRYCENHDLSVDVIVRLVEQAAEAIHHAHLRGVLHRDIKPSNVLVYESDERQARVKVIDFGISKALHRDGESFATPHEQALRAAGASASRDSEELTGEGQLLGTLEYMSPEQLALDSSQLDTRTDVYSLGAMLYRLLCGRPPIARKQLLSRGVSELHRTLVSTHVERPQLTTRRDDLGWIVMKAIEKDRENRYATMHAFLSDLRRYRQRDRVAAHPPSMPYHLRVMLRRHRVAAMAGLLIFAALFLGALGTYWGYRNALTARDDAVEQFNRAESVNERLQASLYRDRIESAWDAIRNGDTVDAKLHLDQVPSELSGLEWELVNSKLGADNRQIIPAGGPATRDLDRCMKTDRLVRVLDDGSV